MSAFTATPLLILDLDGTVRYGKTELGRFVNGPDDVFVFPEAVERMREWKAGGGRIIGVSNQGGIALGHVTRDNVVAAIAKTRRDTEGLFDKIGFCDHHPESGDPLWAHCLCRKPQVGLVFSGMTLLHNTYPEVYPTAMMLMVGDRNEDRDCAGALGIPFLWADHWRKGP